MWKSSINIFKYYNNKSKMDICSVRNVNNSIQLLVITQEGVLTLQNCGASICRRIPAISQGVQRHLRGVLLHPPGAAHAYKYYVYVEFEVENMKL